jgi:hypothetical protein
VAASAVRALPFTGEEFASRIEAHARSYRRQTDAWLKENPFGVPISTGGWGGAGFVVNVGVTNYLLYKAFPSIIDPTVTFRSLDYIFGRHPGSNLSFVSGVGVRSKLVAYGANRADYSYIAGGVVPGIVVLKPDLPENKEDWPFLWGENEYVIGLAASYITLVNAAHELAKGSNE